MPTMLQRNPPPGPATRIDRRNSTMGKSVLRPADNQGAQASVDAARARMQQVGSGYTGSVWSAPGSYTAARPAGAPPAARTGAAVGSAGNPSPNPINPVQRTGLKAPGPGTAPGRGGIDVRSYTGSMFGQPGKPPTATPIPGYQPQPTSEEAADRALRAKFGAPPNERGQIDIAAAGKPVQSLAIPNPIKPAQQTEAANPLSGAETTQPEDTSAPTPTAAVQAPAKSLGVATRGGGTPAGQDALPRDPNVGGSGVYARRFANPQSASLYDQYTKRLFGSAATATA